MHSKCTRETNSIKDYHFRLPFTPGENDLTRPGLLDTSGATYKGYMAALDRGDRLDDSPEPDFLIRPKMVVWMVSHCSTESGRSRD